MKFLFPILLLLCGTILNGAVGDAIIQVKTGTTTTTEQTITKITSHLIGWDGSGTLTAIATPTGTVGSVSATDSTGIDFTITNPTLSPTISLALTSAAVGLSNVENTALSTWAGSSNLTTLAANAARDNLTGGSGTLNLSAFTLTLPSDVTRLGSSIDLSGAEATGTLADARFPATLPAISGANLTSLDPYDLQQRGATDGQAMIWSTANSRWEPGTVSGGGGISDGDTLTTGLTFPNSGLKQIDFTNALEYNRISTAYNTDTLNNKTLLVVFDAAGDASPLGITFAAAAESLTLTSDATVAGTNTGNVTVTDTDTFDFGLTGQALTGSVRTQMSITSDASGIKLSGDSTSPGNNKVYGTDGSGTKGWYTAGSGSGDALVANPLSQFAATTSAQLRGVLTDEEGTGVFLTANGSAASLTSFPTLNQNTTGTAGGLLTSAITGLTADATPNGASDYVMTYDASATAMKKVLLDDLPGGSSANLDDAGVAYVRTGATGGTIGDPLDPFANITAAHAAFVSVSATNFIFDLDTGAHSLTLDAADVDNTNVYYFRGAGPSTVVTFDVTGASGANGNPGGPGTTIAFGDGANPFVIQSDHSCVIDFNAVAGAGGPADVGSDGNGGDGGDVVGNLLIQNAIAEVSLVQGSDGVGDGVGSNGASGIVNMTTFKTVNSTVADPDYRVLATKDSLVNGNLLVGIDYVTQLATGVADFLKVPSSANLRTALTDEVGTGAAYFVGGALGTPASGTLTNTTAAVEAYDATGWNGDDSPAAKNDIRDKIESMSGGGSGVGVYRHVFIPAAAFIPRTTTGAGVDSRESSTNKINTDELLFDKDTDEFSQFVTHLDNWDAGTVKAKFVWTASSGSGDVIWTLSGVAISDDDALDAAQGTLQSVTDTMTAVADKMTSGATAAITIGGTPAADDTLVFEVSRDANNGSDTFSTDARLLGVWIQYKETTTAPSVW